MNSDNNLGQGNDTPRVDAAEMGWTRTLNLYVVLVCFAMEALRFARVRDMATLDAGHADGVEAFG